MKRFKQIMLAVSQPLFWEDFYYCVVCSCVSCHNVFNHTHVDSVLLSFNISLLCVAHGMKSTIRFYTVSICGNMWPLYFLSASCYRRRSVQVAQQGGFWWVRIEAVHTGENEGTQHWASGTLHGRERVWRQAAQRLSQSSVTKSDPGSL